MARRQKSEDSPQVAEAVATVLVIGYLAIQYAPLTWGTSALCVIVFLVVAAIALLVWKKPHPGRRREKPAGIGAIDRATEEGTALRKQQQ